MRKFLFFLRDFEVKSVVYGLGALGHPEAGTLFSFRLIANDAGIVPGMTHGMKQIFSEEMIHG